KSASRGDPAGESRGGSPTARGKRVPGAEINVQLLQAIKIDKVDFHRVCLQSDSCRNLQLFLCVLIWVRNDLTGNTISGFPFTSPDFMRKLIRWINFRVLLNS
ncbi:hypothetical protein ASG97_19635, partial [Bacillus sp. Soil745]